MPVHYQGIKPKSGKKIESAITVPDCWDVTIMHADGESLMEVETPGAAPDQDGETKQDAMFPGGMIGNYIGRMGPKGAAENIITLVATSAFHEALECVKLRNKQLAIPHPNGYTEESRMWDWLQKRMLDTLHDYQEEFGTP